MSSAPWIELSFQFGSDIRHIYSVEEAAGLIADGVITPSTKVTAFTDAGPKLMLAGSLSQMPFFEPEPEPEPAGTVDDGITDVSASVDGAAPLPPVSRERNSDEGPEARGRIAGDEGRGVDWGAETSFSMQRADGVFAGPIIFQALRRYADFDGRASRAEYWMFALFSLLALLAMAIIGPVLGEALGTLVMVLGCLGLIVPSISVTIRRFHDQNLTGWLTLIGLIPYLGWLGLVAFMLLDGTRGPNKYGMPPPV